MILPQEADRRELTRVAHVKSLFPVTSVPSCIALVAPPLVHEDEVGGLAFGHVRTQGDMIETASPKYTTLFVQREQDQVGIGQWRIVKRDAKWS